MYSVFLLTTQGKGQAVTACCCSVSGRSFGYEYSMSDTFENSGEDNSQDDVVDIIVLPDAGDQPRIVGKGFPQPPPHYFCEYTSIVLE